MGRKRQSFSKEFKAKVVLDALREESTIQEIAVFPMESTGNCRYG